MSVSGDHPSPPSPSPDGTLVVTDMLTTASGGPKRQGAVVLADAKGSGQIAMTLTCSVLLDGIYGMGSNGVRVGRVRR